MTENWFIVLIPHLCPISDFHDQLHVSLNAGQKFCGILHLLTYVNLMSVHMT